MAVRGVPAATEDQSSPGHTWPSAMAGVQCRLQWTAAECALWCGAEEMSAEAEISAETALGAKDGGSSTSMNQDRRDQSKEYLEGHILNVLRCSIFHRTCWDRTRKILMPDCHCDYFFPSGWCVLGNTVST